MRATEGWAALQHHSVLHTSITVHPPSKQPYSHPHLLVDVQQGSFFTVRPSEKSGHLSGSYVPRWHAGNIYALDASPPHSIPLPSPPSATEPTVYDLFVSGDYEVCRFAGP